MSSIPPLRRGLSQSQLVDLALSGTELTLKERATLSQSQLLRLAKAGSIELTDAERQSLSQAQLLDLPFCTLVLTPADRRRLSRAQLLDLDRLGADLSDDEVSRLSPDQKISLAERIDQRTTQADRETGVVSELERPSILASVQSSQSFHCWKPEKVFHVIASHVSSFTQKDILDMFRALDLRSQDVRGIIRQYLDWGTIREEQGGSSGQKVFQMDRARREETHALLHTPKDDTIMPTTPSASKRTKVFVIHGRSEAMRTSMFQFLRAIGLHPLEWTEAIQFTGKAAPYIGEVLDAAFAVAQAIIALHTPDDIVRLHPKLVKDADEDIERQPTGQARPNVLFETGLAMGRSPDRTVIVEVGRLRPYSDVAGRHAVRLTDAVGARQDLAMRIRRCGCEVNLEGTDWHTTGKFSIDASWYEFSV